MWNHVVFVVTVLLYSVSSQNTKCVCVPFYQCRENGTVNTNGEGIIDERLGGCTSCNCTNVLETCCNLPISNPEPSNRSPSSPSSCGYSNPEGVGFKLGVESDDALFGEFPWMIQVLEDGSYRCGGSLIHPSVVLTAAHCIKSPNSTYTARGGEWDRNNTDEVLKHQDRKVATIKIHEKYEKEIYYNDVALLFLEQPFELKAHVNTTCLVPVNTVVDKKRCIAIGWGKARYAPGQDYSKVLKKVDLPMIGKSTCQKYLRTTRLGSYFILHDSFICAGGEKNKDTCTGDGGGPLFCPIEEDEDRYMQVGVTAWGIDCNLENVPGVYANVAYVRKWIDTEMKRRNFDTQSYTF